MRKEINFKSNILSTNSGKREHTDYSTHLPGSVFVFTASSLLGFLLLLFSACAGHSFPCPYIKVISPNGEEIWKEGKTYEIKWKSAGVKRVCITVGIGGKEKGLITGDCNIDAKKGEITWTIPKGFVSNFGISRADNVKILIFDPDNPKIQDFSDGYFTITSSARSNSARNRVKPSPCSSREIKY